MIEKECNIVCGKVKFLGETVSLTNIQEETDNLKSISSVRRQNEETDELLDTSSIHFSNSSKRKHSVRFKDEEQKFQFRNENQRKLYNFRGNTNKNDVSKDIEVFELTSISPNVVVVEEEEILS